MQEPWLLHDFAEDFYGEDLHLVIVGYIRPEVLLSMISFCNFLPFLLFFHFHAKHRCGI